MPQRLDSPFHPWRAADRVDRVAVTDGHELHVEEVGPLDGAPVVILHGGPGGGIKPYYRRLVDPTRHRGIFFEQRGCGRSTPFGSLTANTTWDLVADIERLREHLGIDSWSVFGGSWGSTLALAYAEAHPDRVRALVVTGVFLGDTFDSWWWWDGLRSLYPEVWHEVRTALPEAERADPRRSYLDRILGSDVERATAAAITLGRAEAMVLDVWPDESEPSDTPEGHERELAAMRTFAHYDHHAWFLEPGQLLRDASRIRSVPGRIVNGRFDGVTPPRSAFDLAEAWGAPLEIVPAAGHRWNDPLLGGAVVRALAELAR